jgi:hypothetical protein
MQRFNITVAQAQITLLLINTLDSFSERVDFSCAKRTRNQPFQKNCPNQCL